MIVAVIPAWNEATQVGEVIRKTRPFVDRVLVINDGSTDETARVAKEAGATVLSHVVNRGLGATLGTGIEAAHRMGATHVVTLDADGQHLPEEIQPFIEKLDEGYDVVIGSRMIEQKGNMSARRKLYQRIGNLLTYLLFGTNVTDSQSGFRAFSREAAGRLEIRTDRMEVSSEIISELGRKQFKWAEVPITAVYTDYSLSKGQSFTVGVKTAFKLILHRLKT